MIFKFMLCVCWLFHVDHKTGDKFYCSRTITVNLNQRFSCETRSWQIFFYFHFRRQCFDSSAIKILLICFKDDHKLISGRRDEPQNKTLECAGSRLRSKNVNWPFDVALVAIFTELNLASDIVPLLIKTPRVHDDAAKWQRYSSAR